MLIVIPSNFQVYYILSINNRNKTVLSQQILFIPQWYLYT